LLIIWAYGIPDFGGLDGKLATAIVVYITPIIWAVSSIIPRRADREKIQFK